MRHIKPFNENNTYTIQNILHDNMRDLWNNKSSLTPKVFKDDIDWNLFHQLTDILMKAIDVGVDMKIILRLEINGGESTKLYSEKYIDGKITKEWSDSVFGTYEWQFQRAIREIREGYNYRIVVITPLRDDSGGKKYNNDQKEVIRSVYKTIEKKIKPKQPQIVINRDVYNYQVDLYVYPLRTKNNNEK